jgi:tRNA 2-thiouridine synthesizing protein A
VIDIPALINETGDKVEITARDDNKIVFLIEKISAAGKAPTAG